MSALEIKMYELFKAKFGEAEANTVIDYFEQKAEEKINQKKDIFLTKDDKIDIITRIEGVRSELIKWMFLFWIGQLASFIAIAKFFFHP